MIKQWYGFAPVPHRDGAYSCLQCGSTYTVESVVIFPDRETTTVVERKCDDCPQRGREVVNLPGSQRTQNQETKTMNLRKLTVEDVKFELSIEEETMSVKEGLPDQEHDELVVELQDRLRRGDLWAWCTVVVKATWEGHVGEDTLGCCSYDHERDFVRNSGYYEDMKQRAVDDLNEQLERQFKKLQPLLVS